MFQPFPKAICGVGYGRVGGVQHVGVIDGQGSATLNTGRAPMPSAGICRHLVVTRAPSLPDVEVEILLDNVSTGLVVTLPTGSARGVNPFTEIEYVQGQTLTYLIATATDEALPGFDIGVCVELEADVLSFGVVAQFLGSASVGYTQYAGALGNGFWADNRSSYSINALGGSATTLILRRNVAQSGGSWKAWLELAGVLQDGSGGTIDTACELLDSDPDTLAVNFDLPATPPQHLNVVLERLGSEASFGFEQIGAGIAFRPAIANQFMLCGGSNDLIPIPGTTWKWNHSHEQGSTIVMHQASTGLRAFRASAMYVEHSQSPGTGEQFTDTLLSGGVATDIAAVLVDAESSASDVGSAQFQPESSIVIQLDSTAGAAATAKFYWGIAMDLIVGPQRGNIGPIAWLDWTRRQP